MFSVVYVKMENSMHVECKILRSVCKDLNEDATKGKDRI